MPENRRTLLALKGFNGRGASRHSSEWMRAIDIAREVPEADLPVRTQRGAGPPTPRAWAVKDPEAGRRLALPEEAMTALTAKRTVTPETLMNPTLLGAARGGPPH